MVVLSNPPYRVLGGLHSRHCVPTPFGIKPPILLENVLVEGLAGPSSFVPGGGPGCVVCDIMVGKAAAERSTPESYPRTFLSGRAWPTKAFEHVVVGIPEDLLWV